MKKFVRSMFAIVLAVSMAVSAGALAFAVDGSATAQANSEIVEPNGPKYSYKTEYLPTQKKTVSNYASNQLSGGVYLSNSGDGIYYVAEGGASVTVGVSVALPKPYNALSFSASVGKVKDNAVSGYVKTLGKQKPGYYKLYLHKTYEVRPFVVYRKPKIGSGGWKIYSADCVAKYVSVRAELKRVK